MARKRGPVAPFRSSLGATDQISNLALRFSRMRSASNSFRRMTNGSSSGRPLDLLGGHVVEPREPVAALREISTSFTLNRLGQICAATESS